jgi:hypothetical protein
MRPPVSPKKLPSATPKDGGLRISSIAVNRPEICDPIKDQAAGLSEEIGAIKARLDELHANAATKASVDELHAKVDTLIEARKIKDWYTTAELAEILLKRPFTVRQWCNNKRIHAKKRECGRGNSGEWMIAHEELMRIQNQGLLPLPKD